jgi:Domain of unknown function (DUF4190)
MSDTARGPGWWQASDGRWYPPELHPGLAAPWGPPPLAAPVTQQTNGLAIASLVLSIAAVGIGSILAVVFGAIARRQIRDSHGRQGGDGIAIAGLVIGATGLFASVAVLVIVIVLIANGNFPDQTQAISGAPGYSTTTGDHGFPLAEGRPWGRPCQPIVFQVNRAMPTQQYVLIGEAVENARSLGLDVTLETRDLYWYPSLLYPAGLTNSSVQVVPIFPSTESSTLPNGQPEHISFGWDSRLTSDGNHEAITDLQATLYLNAVKGDPQATLRSVRQLVAYSQGVTGSTLSDSSIAEGNEQDGYSRRDLAAMQKMSGCTFEPTTAPPPSSA